MKIGEIKVGVEYALWGTTAPEPYHTPWHVRAEEIGTVPTEKWAGRGWTRSMVAEERRVRVSFVDPDADSRVRVAVCTYVDDRAWVSARYLLSTWAEHEEAAAAAKATRDAQAQAAAKWQADWAEVVPVLVTAGVKVQLGTDGFASPRLLVALTVEQAKALVAALTREEGPARVKEQR